MFKRRHGRQARDGGDPSKFFVHVPKAAGTSFRKALETRYGKRLILDYGEAETQTSPEVKDWVYHRKDLFAFRTWFREQSSRVIAGHVGLMKYADFVGLENIVTFVREPVSRVISHYKHAERHLGWTEGFESFVRSPAYRNVQTRFLSSAHYAGIGILGLSERFSESVALLNHRWQEDFPVLTENTAESYSSVEVQVTDRDIDLIKECNSEDLLLYERSLTIFENSLHCMQREVADRRAFVAPAPNGKSITGWTFAFDEKPIRVVLCKNGSERMERTCVEFRPHLAGLGFPRGGYVGFSAPCPDIVQGDLISIVDIETGLMLAEIRI